jgi:hypothetical protein
MYLEFDSGKYGKKKKKRTCVQCLYFFVQKHKQIRLSPFTQQHYPMRNPKPFAGFEPGSSVPQADVMTTAPRQIRSG